MNHSHSTISFFKCPSLVLSRIENLDKQLITLTVYQTVPLSL